MFEFLPSRCKLGKYLKCFAVGDGEFSIFELETREHEVHEQPFIFHSPLWVHVDLFGTVGATFD